MSWQKVKCDSGSCVEVNHDVLGAQVLVRTSQRTGEFISLTEDEWHSFLEAIKKGEFDL